MFQISNCISNTMKLLWVSIIKYEHLWSGFTHFWKDILKYTITTISLSWEIILILQSFPGPVHEGIPMVYVCATGKECSGAWVGFSTDSEFLRNIPYHHYPHCITIYHLRRVCQPFGKVARFPNPPNSWSRLNLSVALVVTAAPDAHLGGWQRDVSLGLLPPGIVP